MMYSGTALIQAVSLAFQAATAIPVFSTTLEATGSGGLLQSMVPEHGLVTCSAPTALSTGPNTIDSSAFLLVASGTNH